MRMKLPVAGCLANGSSWLTAVIGYRDLIFVISQLHGHTSFLKAARYRIQKFCLINGSQAGAQAT